MRIYTYRYTYTSIQPVRRRKLVRSWQEKKHSDSYNKFMLAKPGNVARDGLALSSNVTLRYVSVGHKAEVALPLNLATAEDVMALLRLHLRLLRPWLH